MRVALTFNVKRNDPSKNLNEQSDLEFDSIDVIDGIKDALIDLGHEVLLIEATDSAFIELKKFKDSIDIVFNIAEGMWGDARESQIPLFCEVLKIPYTHSSPTTHAITLNKEFTKFIVKGAGVARVPSSQTISSKNYQLDKTLSFPLIVKPNKEGSSKGILDKNVISSESDLKRAIKEVSEDFTKEVLVEEYIEGREFTVPVLGNGLDIKVLPVVEQKFDFLPKGMHRIASFELKWVYEDTLKDLHDAYDCPARLGDGLKNEIEETSKMIYQLLRVRDVARLDFRLNSEGNLYFLEINTLPGLISDENVISYLPTSSRVAGMKFKDLVNEILGSAVKRYKI